jgi:phosphoribosyl 1,2-cyclic phosphodiesterase
MEIPLKNPMENFAMKVRFWGVRGSIPTPGPTTVRYGGNTSCVSIEFAGNHVLVLDAGTGIRLLGDELAQGDAEISMALTHAHWDHIQGFPFFAPLFQPGRTVLFAPHMRARQLFETLVQQMDGARFPVAQDQLPSILRFLPEAGFKTRIREIAEVTRLKVNHPGNADGVRIHCNGHTVVYIPDNELDPPDKPITRFEDIVAFCKHADVLIHDAQYLEEEMSEKRGWGHSAVERVCDLAAEAEVAHLVLFHHDPGRTDDQLDAIHDKARTRLAHLGSPARCSAAYEGLVL